VHSNNHSVGRYFLQEYCSAHLLVRDRACLVKCSDISPDRFVPFPFRSWELILLSSANLWWKEKLFSRSHLTTPTIFAIHKSLIGWKWYEDLICQNHFSIRRLEDQFVVRLNQTTTTNRRNDWLVRVIAHRDAHLSVWFQSTIQPFAGQWWNNKSSNGH
jgi:hypothetical protein